MLLIATIKKRVIKEMISSHEEFEMVDSNQPGSRMKGLLGRFTSRTKGGVLTKEDFFAAHRIQRQ
jgi:hypothetical protein